MSTTSLRFSKHPVLLAKEWHNPAARDMPALSRMHLLHTQAAGTLSRMHLLHTQAAGIPINQLGPAAPAMCPW
jgi:hypothetical protein